MAVDPAGNQLFAAVNAGAAGRVQLRVYDQSTLALITTIDPPPDAPVCGGCWIAPMVVLNRTRRAYILVGGVGYTALKPQIYVFDVLPNASVSTARH